MAKPVTDLAPKIREKTLELLMEKEPQEISMREIAKACEITATSIYYYYKDKDTLFTEIKLICLKNMHEYIVTHTKKKVAKYEISHEKPDALIEMRSVLEAFRDWAFKNPRITLLVMGRFKPDSINNDEDMKNYYQSIDFGRSILDKAVREGVLHSTDTMLDTSLCVAALWGAIESVSLKLSVPQYWSKKGAIEFTDKMINFLLASLRSTSSMLGDQ